MRRWAGLLLLIVLAAVVSLSGVSQEAIAYAEKPTLVNLQVDLETPEDAEHALDLLALIESYGWYTTVYVTGEFTLQFPELVKEIHDLGHQIGVGGWGKDEDLESLSYEETYNTVENALLAVRAAVGNMRPAYIADFKPQGHQPTEVLLQVLAGLEVRSCTGVFPAGPDHSHHLEGTGLVGIPLAERPQSGDDCPCSDDGLVLADDEYIRAGKSIEEFFADLRSRYDVNRRSFRPFAAALHPSIVASGHEGLEMSRAFLDHLAGTPGHLVVVDQLTVQANPFIDWIEIDAPDVARAGETITVTVRYSANCYCPWYYFQVYSCTEGWLKCNLPLVRGLFWENEWPEADYVNVGEHQFTFDVQLPLRSGNYTYRLVAVGQACHGGPCWPTYSETIPAKFDVIGSTNIQVTDAPVRLVFVPLNWNSTQAAFDSYVTAEVQRFVENTPLQECTSPVYAYKMSVAEHNIADFTGDLDDLRSRTNEMLRELGISDDDLFHVVVGVAPNSEGLPAAGRSNTTDTVWVVDDYTYVLAHELGHTATFGNYLKDEYCSHDAGSPTDAGWWCSSATATPNPLDADQPCDCPSDGETVDQTSGVPCCEDPAKGWDCEGGYHVCCYGNRVEEGGTGRCIMSYANAPGPRSFCIHCQAQLDLLPIFTECGTELQAMSTDGETDTEPPSVVVLELMVYRDGSVEERDVGVRLGTTAPLPWPSPFGVYALSIVDVDGTTVFEERFDLFFGHTGPVVPGVDYSGIQYDDFLLSTRIPFHAGMYSVSLHHEDRLIYSRNLPVATIRGAVAAGEAPIAGALVSARGPSFAFTRTDSQGRYALSVMEAGQYSMSVQPTDPNLMPAYQTTQVELEQVYTLDFDLQLGGSVVGTVTDATGEPVVDAWIYPDVYEPPYYKVQENGEYLISALDPGTYSVAIDAPGFGSWYIYVDGLFVTEGMSVAVEVQTGKTTTVDFRQTPYAGTLFCDDLEYADQADAEEAGWAFGGLWHMTDHATSDAYSPSPVPFASPTHAAYFGDVRSGTYGAGVGPASLTPVQRASSIRTKQLNQPRGELVSPNIPVGGQPAVEVGFNYFRQVEYYANGSYDRTYVQVQFNGGQWQTVWELDSTTPSQSTWVESGPIPIAVPAGASSMRVRFVFDSVDDYFNSFLGWLIDDVSISGAETTTVTIITEELPAGTANQAYSATLSAAGGTPPYAWSATGLPSGLSLNASTGVLAGTPTGTGGHTVTATVTDAAQGAAARSYQLTVNAAPGGMLYEENFVDSSDWTMSGLWHATSTLQCADLAGYGAVAYYGIDAACNYDTGARTDGALISPLIDVTGATAVKLQFDHFRQVEHYATGPYDGTRVQVRFDGGQWKTVWELDSKTPSQTTWEVVGPIPIAVPAGASSMRVKFVFDSVDEGFNDHLGWLIDDVSISVAEPGTLGITTQGLPAGAANQAYSVALSAAGGTPPYAWSATGLPGGLTVNASTGVLAGTPTGTGAYTVTATVTDAAQAAAVRSYQLTVNAAPVGLLYEENFADSSGWTMTGLWHATSTLQCADLAVYGPVAYYGIDAACNYETGARTTGALTSPPIDVAGATAVELRFDYFRQVEYYASGPYDNTRVEAKLDDGDWHVIWMRDSTNPSGESWSEAVVAPFATDGAQTLQVRFVFDSVDLLSNDFTGWLVDNIRVESAVSGGPLAAMAVQEGGPRAAPGLMAVLNVPNPIRDDTARFVVRGVDAELMRVEVYDLAGQLVWEGEGQGNEIPWSAERFDGTHLANGVYLYRISVRVSGAWLTGGVQKLVILR